jgi:hypothetical protein
MPPSKQNIKIIKNFNLFTLKSHKISSIQVSIEFIEDYFFNLTRTTDYNPNNFVTAQNSS